jgi:putative endonuclease
MDNWFVYLLECCDGSFYTGTTNDVDKRMDAHASGKGSKYVRKKGFRRLLFAKPIGSRSEACKCEAEIKKLPRCQKLAWFEN